MNDLKDRILRNLYTTVTGLVTGIVTGVAMTVSTGAVTKETLIVGASIGLLGALLKDPERIKRVLGKGN
jgi:hypothetical protein